MTNILISASELQSLLQRQQSLKIFDVRHNLSDFDEGRRLYEQGHIPGAVFLDHEEELSASKTGRNGRHPLPPIAEFIQLMASYGVQPDDHIVVYDAQDSMFAAHAWWMLQWAGCTSVQVLNGGLKAWQAAGGNLEKGEASGIKPAAPWPAPVASMPRIDAAELLTLLDQNDVAKVDARAPERYRGEVEPIDRVAGHIPGFENRFYQENLQQDGTFKSAAELKAAFVSLLNGRDPEQMIVMCGSGVTACHHVLAMQLAGLPVPRLYGGSWSEWIADPQRPAAQGV